MLVGVLSNIDFFITNTINLFLPHNYFFNIFFSFFSLRGNSIFVWILIILFLVLFEGRRNHRFIVFFLISFLTTGYLVSYVFKPVFHRIRPAYRTNIKHSTACPSDYSFPSGHAASAFAAAATLSAFHKKRKYFFYTVAGLISLSRIYFYCHFFVDVAIGAVFGYLVSKIILLIFKK